MPALVPEGERIAVLTLMTRPAESSSGPPEFPGLMAASVWITLVISRPLAVGNRRLSALMMPVVSDWSRPNGLPIANTDCPTLRSSDVPMVIGGGNERGSSTRSTARS
jgi:hypothetical protein